MATTNPYLKDFRTQVRTRFAEDSDKMSYSQWIEKNTKLKKVPFSFKGYEFQRAIVDDMSSNMSVIKCSQIGLTEVQMRKFAAFLARNIGVSGIFTLPNDDMYKRVSSTRFAPMINTEHVFNLGFDKPIRRMDLFQINQSFGYFVGNKESDATSINADLLFHDEVDLSDQEMLGLFQSRLQGSDYRITQGFSTPTFEGFGIDASFRASDQHEYMCKCLKVFLTMTSQKLTQILQPNWTLPERMSGVKTVAPRSTFTTLTYGSGSLAMRADADGAIELHHSVHLVLPSNT